MKQETAALLEKFHNANRLQFITTDKGLELEHDLTDEEKSQIVTSEYGTKLVAPLDDLFVTIIRKMISLVASRAKFEFTDKLSDL